MVFPIYQGTVFESRDGEGYGDIQYHRLNTTPSQRYLHDKLAVLEGADAAVATSSGMAAISTTLLTMMRAGDHLIASNVLYGGTYELLNQYAERLGWSFSLVDPHRPRSWEDALRSNTKAMLMETITNPLVRVGRLTEAAAFASAHGLISIIDNTFASPVNFRPHEHGFNLSVHSATKYLGGHSDLVAGCVIGNQRYVDAVRSTLTLFGGCLDPQTGFLLARGLKTLAVRMAAQNANATALASMLSQHPAVADVSYPGLRTHPDHSSAAELLDGFGGMLSFRPTGGLVAAEKVLGALRLPYVGPSLGGVETLVTRPAATSHAGMSAADRERAGVTDDLIRVSCGIEGVDDLVGDFEQAVGSL